MTGVFDPSYEELPLELPIFPLAGALLLPHSKLPLNVFEPRYLNLTTAALQGSRLIGMIQPKEENGGTQPLVYNTGCAGRITAFSETADGRYLITLDGISRFNIAEELPIKEGYRSVIPDWGPYKTDLIEEKSEGIDRSRLLDTLKNYFRSNQIDADWAAIKETPSDRLINALAMMCPFQPSEKQALLEANTFYARADVLVALLEMSLSTSGDLNVLHKN